MSLNTISTQFSAQQKTFMERPTHTRMSRIHSSVTSWERKVNFWRSALGFASRTFAAGSGAGQQLEQNPCGWVLPAFWLAFVPSLCGFGTISLPVAPKAQDWRRAQLSFLWWCICCSRTLFLVLPVDGPCIPLDICLLFLSCLKMSKKILIKEICFWCFKNSNKYCTCLITVDTTQNNDHNIEVAV